MWSSILFSPLNNTTTDVVKGFLGILGFIISLAITAAVVFALRKPLTQVLEKLIGDEDIAKKIMLFILALIVLAGLYSAIGSFYPERFANQIFSVDNKLQAGPFFHFILYGLLNLFSAYAEVLKWAIVAIAIFFVGYSVRKAKIE